ncbi:hypothetical protein TNCV_2920591 [Trichonephila clavipes]|nr:hypothetical protein TNCV_2920591 [Trichonephila clavipes]
MSVLNVTLPYRCTDAVHFGNFESPFHAYRPRFCPFWLRCCSLGLLGSWKDLCKPGTRKSVIRVTSWLWVMNLIILNHGQEARTAPEPESPLLTSTQHQLEPRHIYRVSAPSASWVFSFTRLELMIRQLRVRYLDH